MVTNQFFMDFTARFTTKFIGWIREIVCLNELIPNDKCPTTSFRSFSRSHRNKSFRFRFWKTWKTVKKIIRLRKFQLSSPRHVWYAWKIRNCLCVCVHWLLFEFTALYGNHIECLYITVFDVIAGAIHHQILLPDDGDDELDFSIKFGIEYDS